MVNPESKMHELKYMNLVDTLSKFAGWVKVLLLALAFGGGCGFAAAPPSVH
jgi:hypothetical protein